MFLTEKKKKWGKEKENFGEEEWNWNCFYVRFRFWTNGTFQICTQPQSLPTPFDPSSYITTLARPVLWNQSPPSHRRMKPDVKLYQDNVFHGFSAVLSPDQVSSLSRHPTILAVFEDKSLELHTTRSPQFLGLRNQSGLWSESDYGSDVIIGVFDTRIWPERRSF